MDGFDFFASRTNAPPQNQSQVPNQHRMTYVQPMNQQAIGMMNASPMMNVPMNAYAYGARPVNVPVASQQRSAEDPAEAAKRRQFMEQQRKMKDFGALTKTQIDADSYAKSLFGPSAAPAPASAISSVNSIGPSIVDSVIKPPPSSAMQTSSKPANMSPSNSFQATPVRQSPPVVLEVPKKSLEEVMISMCDITADTKPKSQQPIISNKSRGKEQPRQVPFWLTDEGMAALPPLYTQMLQFVCADSPDKFPNVQKVFSAFSNFGVDYSRISSILLLTRRSLPNGQMTPREFVEALALVIISRQGVQFSGVDYLLTLPSAPLPPAAVLPTQLVEQTTPRIPTVLPTANINTTAPPMPMGSFPSVSSASTSVTATFPVPLPSFQTSTPPVVAAPVSSTTSQVSGDDDFGDDDFQSFQSAGAKAAASQSFAAPPTGSVTPFNSTAHVSSPSPVVKNTLEPKREPVSSVDRYAALRELEDDSPEPEITLEPVFGGSRQPSAQRDVDLRDNRPPQSSQTSPNVGLPAFGKPETPAAVTINDDDDWADFSAASFTPQPSDSAKPVDSTRIMPPIPQNNVMSSNSSSLLSQASLSAVPEKNRLGSLEADFSAFSSTSHQPSKPAVAVAQAISESHDDDIWSDAAIKTAPTTGANVSALPSVTLTPLDKLTGSTAKPILPYIDPIPSSEPEPIVLAAPVVRKPNSQVDLYFDDDNSEKKVEDETDYVMVAPVENRQSKPVSGPSYLSSMPSVAKPAAFVNFDSLMDGPPDIAAFDSPPPPQPMEKTPSPQPPLFEQTLTTSNFSTIRQSQVTNNNNERNDSYADLDDQFFASLTSTSFAASAPVPPTNTVTDSVGALQDQPNLFRETSPSLRARTDTSHFDTVSVSSLDLAKFPNEPAVPDSFGSSMPPPPSSTSPASFSIDTPDVPTKQHKNPIKSEDDFADFCKADTLSFTTGPPEQPTPDFHKISFDSFNDSSKQSNSKTSTKAMHNFSAFDDDIPESSLAPPLFSSSFTPLASAQSSATMLPPGEIFKRAVKAACTIVHEAVVTFQDAKHTDETIMEAMCTKRGRTFVSSIREVREIVRRLKSALPRTVPDGDYSLSSVLEVFVQFETAWSALVDLLPQQIVDVLSNVSGGPGTPLTPLQANAVQPSSTSVCSLCLGNLSVSPNAKQGPLSAISLKTKRSQIEQFHAVCANFWANCVEARPSSSSLDASSNEPDIPSLISLAVRRP